MDHNGFNGSASSKRLKSWRLKSGALLLGCLAITTAACGGTTINQTGKYNQTCEKKSSCAADIGDLEKADNSRQTIVWTHEYMPPKNVVTHTPRESWPAQPELTSYAKYQDFARTVDSVSTVNRVLWTAHVAKDALVTFGHVDVQELSVQRSDSGNVLTLGGGASYRIEVQISLGNHAAKVRYRNGDSDFTDNLSLVLTQNDTVAFDISAWSDGSTVKWRGDLEYTINNKPYQLPLADSDNGPFTVTGDPKADPHFFYAGTDWRRDGA
ncbi:hypothetical protein [Streptomyces sp. NBC_00986]|uniref:hypothetical protein n=1 Tax=Streptomyces sp. NBC_00986 TaxID=2903702 RepID=UPI003866A0B7|nr:hypothetical protein OG504_33195 [Streptomyces sp. NBC_00986]